MVHCKDVDTKKCVGCQNGDCELYSPNRLTTHKDAKDLPELQCNLCGERFYGDGHSCIPGILKRLEKIEKEIDRPKPPKDGAE